MTIQSASAAELWRDVGTGIVGAVALMLILWLLHLWKRDAGLVDFGWAVALAGLAVWLAIQGNGEWWRRWLIAILAALSNLRLALHLLLTRIVGHGEDGRYRQLRQWFGRHAPWHFLWFFLAQGVLVGFMALPFALASRIGDSRFLWTDAAAIVIWLMATSGEALADAQLHRWRSQPAHRGRTCRQGLWHYSRHPNYFFQWLLWVSYALFAVPATYGWLAWLPAIVMLLLVTRVTGIPYAEAQAIRSRGEDYRDYQRSTSAFVPWWPKRT